jgi:hypothetical protein
MAGRVPELWIGPDHILDLRVRVRLRHTLVDDQRVWQQRIRAVLYHHGSPHRRELTLLTAAGREWLKQLPLPAVARDRIAVGLLMSDALDAQLPPITKQLCSYARSPAGLQGADGLLRDRGADLRHDPRRARRRQTVLVLQTSRSLWRHGHHSPRVGSTPRARHLSRQGPPTLRWALYEAAQAASSAGSPDREYYVPPSGRPARARPRLLTLAANSPNAATTPCEDSVRRRSRPHDPSPCAPSPPSHRCAAASSRQPPAATLAWTASQDRAAATLPPAGSPHRPSCRRLGANPGRGPR